MRIFHAASLTAILLCKLKLVALMDSDDDLMHQFEFNSIYTRVDEQIAATTMERDPTSKQEIDQQISEAIAKLKVFTYDPNATVKTSTSCSPTVEASTSSSPVEMKHENPHDCPICLQNFSLGEEIFDLQCWHIFHKTCSEPWFRRDPICPTCRLGIDGTKPDDQWQHLMYKKRHHS